MRIQNLLRLNIILVFFLLYLGNSIFSQNLQFYKEEMTFEIKDHYFYVSGFYYFCNNENNVVSKTLFYPFPNEIDYGHVDSVVAINLKQNSENLIMNVSPKGGFFKVYLEAFGTAKYKVAYRQKINKNKVEYILITTQDWNKPFECASYKLIVPSNIMITSESYLHDSISRKNELVIYYWDRINFMPNKNMIFEFSKNDNNKK